MDATGVEVLKAVFSLLQALIWPLIVLFVVLYFGRQVKKFLQDAGEFSFKAGPTGFEASAKRQQIEAAAALGAATASNRQAAEQAVQADPQQRGPVGPQAVPGGGVSRAATRAIADLVDEATQPRTAQRLAGASVLWVDDRPTGNTYERQSLEALGLTITTSTSTDDALERLRGGGFDVVITDMGRPPDQQAGYTLLEAIRQSGSRVPVIIYAGSASPEHRAEARRRGALDSTNDPQELFRLVVRAIQGK
jgi:CheY-like chemotaxis protein